MVNASTPAKTTPLVKVLAYAFAASGALSAGVLAFVWVARREPPVCIEQILAVYQGDAEYASLTIEYPLNGTLFPPEIPSPTFRWRDSREDADLWLVTVWLEGVPDPIACAIDNAEWTPTDEQWKAIKRCSTEKQARVAVLGLNRADPRYILSAGHIALGVSQDAVGAPIFYREVNLPFKEAVRDPAAQICWRFGEVSSKERPPVVLDRLPVCGNCHSFSADGAVMGMDVDYANDKGAYVVRSVAAEMTLERNQIITWSDYRRADKERTFGLLSQVSPDGRYVVSTVKDRSVFVATDDLTFSQLFFPIKGILAIYDRQTKTFAAIPGADDPQFVQSNPVWSPDGKQIVFARSKAYRLKYLRNENQVVLGKEECVEFLQNGRTFLFDLFRIPFHGGRGGQAEPLAGASDNGMSNYFPKYSPDGKWIVFCKAKSFMLLQPDSQLYIIPAEGGQARRMQCNTSRMNSWHSWSPNGKWLVFSSKVNSPYTQLFLTHMDSCGDSTPPVLLSQFTAPDRAANIPEFVNVRPGAIRRIRERFVDDASHVEAGRGNAYDGQYALAVRSFRQALEINPNNADAEEAWGVALVQQRRFGEGEVHLRKAIQLQPERRDAHFQLGMALGHQNRRREALDHLRAAVRIDPAFPLSHLHLGILLLDEGRVAEARTHLAESLRLDGSNPAGHTAFGVAALRARQPGQAADCFRRALEKDPNHVEALLRLALLRVTSKDPALRDGEEAIALAAKACRLTRYEDPKALVTLADVYAELGRQSEAVTAAEAALKAARAAGDESLANTISRQLEASRRANP